MQRMKFDFYLPPHIKINSKWANDLNVWPETVKVWEGSREKAFHHWSDNNFFCHDTKSKGDKSKIRQMRLQDCIKLKNFCTAKETSTK